MPLSNYPALAFLFLWTIGLAAQSSEPLPVYDRFDDFAAEKLEVAKGEVRLINFWATWCKPCVKELPYFQQLHEKYPDLPMLLVSLDKKTDADSKIGEFLGKRGITIPCVVLADGRANDWIDKVSTEWSGSIPATLIVTSEGRYFYETDFESMEAIEAKTQIYSLIKNNK